MNYKNCKIERTDAYVLVSSYKTTNKGNKIKRLYNISHEMYGKDYGTIPPLTTIQECKNWIDYRIDEIAAFNRK